MYRSAKTNICIFISLGFEFMVLLQMSMSVILDRTTVTNSPRVPTLLVATNVLAIAALAAMDSTALVCIQLFLFFLP